MRNLTAVIGIGLLAAACSGTEQPATPQTTEPVEQLVAFAGATIIDGTGADPIANGVILVRGGRIEAIGAAGEVPIPIDAERVNVRERWIIPGLINAHGHVGDVRGLESGHYSEDNVLRQLALNARYGVTTVNSLGDDQAIAEQIRGAETSPDLDRARLLFAGPVVTASSPEEARGRINEIALMNPDFIKIRVDDNLGASTKMPPEVYEAAIDAAHDNQLPLAVHVYYLDDTKALLRAGADFIAHSVRDQPVDQELIDLLVENDVCYCPTLTREVSTYVYEEIPDFFDDPFFLAEADPDVVEALKDPVRQAGIRESSSAQAYKRALPTALRNVRALADGGVTIAMGTDSGPPARFQGYFEHLEMEMMAEAGMTPMQILVAATGDAARCIGLEETGTLEPGKLADLVVLQEDPLADIRNTQTIESVWISGNRVADRRP